MFRVLNSSNRAVAQRIARSTINFTRAASDTTPEAGSVASSPDAFGKREKAEETRWARRFEAEQAAKYQSAKKKESEKRDKNDGARGFDDATQKRLAELKAEKRRLEQEIDQLKRQKD